MNQILKAINQTSGIFKTPLLQIVIFPKDVYSITQVDVVHNR